MTLDLRIDANGEVGEPLRTSDGDELNFFVRGFIVLAIGRLEVGDSTTLTVTRAPDAPEGKQP